MITDELKQKNFLIFQKKLKEIGIDTDTIDNTINEKIMNATFSISNENNTAYNGSLLNIVLRILTPYALKINELLPEDMRVDKESIIKVCLLSHISKCEMFIKNDNEWEIEKRGLLYKYNKFNLALKMGMRSLIFCQNLGINFTPNEIEAMIIMDRTNDDKQSEFYSSILSNIIRQANELTFLQIREKKL